MSSKRSSSLSTIALLFFAMFSLSGCYTAKKALEKGDYNTAIRKAEKRLNGKKQKDKHILVLETAYEKALYRDLNRIDQLQKEDMIANWKTVLSLYKVLDARQDKLERYLPLYVATEYRDAEFEKHDFKTEINSLKDNAAEYLYRSAQFLKDSKDKEDIREANGLLTDLNKLKPGYKDVSALMRQTLAAGKNYILIQGVSARNLPLPRELSASLLSVQTGKLNQKWLEFHNKPVKSVQYDYTIELNMYQMFVSPGIISENTYTDSRKIEDGWAYELDEKGNVKKDSLGNDIKTTQYKRILCDVVETKLAKNASIGGDIRILSKTGQTLRKVPIEGNAIFDYQFAVANGDLRALTSTSKKKIQRRPQPFPADAELLLQATESIKPVIYEAIRDHGNMLSL